MSSRGSVRSGKSSVWGESQFGPSLNQALSHHFHYETATPFKGSRAGSRKKKGRFLNASNTLALPSILQPRRSSNIIDFGHGDRLGTA